MALSVLVPATSFDLTDVVTVKRDLGLTDPNPSVDDVIRRYIRDASAAIQTVCDRIFAKQTYRETVPGYGGPILALTMRPIISVVQILSNSSPIVDYSIEDTTAGFLYRRNGWVWTAAVGWNLTGYYVNRSEDPIFQVDYVAGYDLPGSTTPNLPGDIERACVEVCKVWFWQQGRDTTVQQVKAGDASVTYFTPVANLVRSLPPNVIEMLIPWKA